LPLLRKLPGVHQQFPFWNSELSNFPTCKPSSTPSLYVPARFPRSKSSRSHIFSPSRFSFRTNP
jgi:hypothetical protein